MFVKNFKEIFFRSSFSATSRKNYKITTKNRNKNLTITEFQVK